MKESPGRLISIIYRKSQMFWSQMLKEHNITSAEYPILITLQKKNGRTQEEVTAVLDIDKSAVARAVQSLEQKGFLEKKKDARDKRCNRIYLTEKGQLSEQLIQKTIQEWNQILTKNMPKEKTEEMMNLLSQMVDNIQEQSQKSKKEHEQREK